MEGSVPEIHTWLHLIRALIYEFFGTMAWLYTFNFTGNNYWARAWSYFTFWIIAVAISGAHFNPALTFAVYLAEGKYLRQAGRAFLQMWF